MTNRDNHALRVAFLGSANWDLVGRDFAKRCPANLGLSAEVVLVPFGQQAATLWDADSALRRHPPDVIIFAERFEDLTGANSFRADSTAAPVDDQKFVAYLERLAAARRLLTGIFLVFDLMPVRPYVASLTDTRSAIDQLNARLHAACEALPDCHLIRLSSLVTDFGARHADPGKYWHMGRMPFSPAFGAALNEHVLRAVRSLRGQTARLIVTDLDNTLWGGIVGEDGLKGLKLGGDFPGNVFADVQRCLLAFKELGVALALCSRNTEATALEAIAGHPAMILRREDFAALRINWNDKAENIRSIASELSLGLASICFIDDSQHERDLVRQALPEVTVPDLPADPSEWPAYLVRHPFLSFLRVTAEDKGRAQRYHLRARIQEEAKSFANRTEYWRSLDMVLHFHRLGEQNIERTLQLLAKTNQFNLTTRRHQELDLERLQREGARVVPFGLADKFSSPEIIGVLILLLPPNHGQPAVIESLLMSCRVLGRSVETAVLGWICEVAKKAGHQELRGELTRTERNIPAQSVYREHGFTETPNGFVLRLDTQAVAMPDYFKIVEE